MFLGILDRKYIFLIRFFVRSKKSQFFVKWEPKKYLSQKKLSGLFEKSVKCCNPYTHSLRIICLWCRDLSCIRFHWLAYSHVQRRNSGHVVNHESWFYDAAWARNHFERRHVLYWSLELQTSVWSTWIWMTVMNSSTSQLLHWSHLFSNILHFDFPARIVILQSTVCHLFTRSWYSWLTVVQQFHFTWMDDWSISINGSPSKGLESNTTPVDQTEVCNSRDQ